jgi:hypothetical protein
MIKNILKEVGNLTTVIERMVWERGVQLSKENGTFTDTFFDFYKTAIEKSFDDLADGILKDLSECNMSFDEWRNLRDIAKGYAWNDLVYVCQNAMGKQAKTFRQYAAIPWRLHEHYQHLYDTAETFEDCEYTSECCDLRDDLMPKIITKMRKKADTCRHWLVINQKSGLGTELYILSIENAYKTAKDTEDFKSVALHNYQKLEPVWSNTLDKIVKIGKAISDLDFVCTNSKPGSEVYKSAIEAAKLLITSPKVAIDNLKQYGTKQIS